MTCNANRRHTSLPQGIMQDGTQTIARELCSTSLTFMQPAARLTRKTYPINEKCALKNGISFEVHQPDRSAPAFGLWSPAWWTEGDERRTVRHILHTWYLNLAHLLGQAVLTGMGNRHGLQWLHTAWSEGDLIAKAPIRNNIFSDFVNDSPWFQPVCMQRGESEVKVKVKCVGRIQEVGQADGEWDDWEQ